MPRHPQSYSRPMIPEESLVRILPLLIVGTMRAPRLDYRVSRSGPNTSKAGRLGIRRTGVYMQQ